MRDGLKKAVDKRLFVYGCGMTASRGCSMQQGSAALFMQLFHERFRSKRFDQVIGHTGLDRFEDSRFLRFGGDHDDRNLFVCLADLADDFQTILARHIPVREHKIKLAGLKFGQGGITVNRFRSVRDASGGQRAHDDLAHRGGVVSD